MKSSFQVLLVLLATTGGQPGWGTPPAPAMDLIVLVASPNGRSLRPHQAILFEDNQTLLLPRGFALSGPGRDELPRLQIAVFSSSTPEAGPLYLSEGFPAEQFFQPEELEAPGIVRGSGAVPYLLGHYLQTRFAEFFAPEFLDPSQESPTRYVSTVSYFRLDKPLALTPVTARSAHSEKKVVAYGKDGVSYAGEEHGFGYWETFFDHDMFSRLKSSTTKPIYSSAGGVLLYIHPLFVFPSDSTVSFGSPLVTKHGTLRGIVVAETNSWTQRGHGYARVHTAICGEVLARWAKIYSP